jgi:integrase
MQKNELMFRRDILAGLPVPDAGKRAYYYDAKVRGLAVSVFPSGAKSFLVYRKVNGKPERITLGKFNPDMPDSREFTAGLDPLILLGNVPELNVKMARIMATAVNAQLDKGMNPGQAKRKARQDAEGELTLRMAFNRYVSDYLVPYEKRTRVTLEENFARYLGSVPQGAKKTHGRERTKPACAVNWERRKLSSIEADEVRRLMIALKDEIGAATANRTMELLRAIYNKMIAWKLYSGANPCSGQEKFKTRTRERFLIGEELPKFFLALAQVENQDFRDYVLLSLTTGARKSNVVAMRWIDIDFDHLIWTVPGAFSKNGDPLTIPLTSAALDVLNGRRGTHPIWVFPAVRSASGHMETPKKHWAALLQQAGLKDLHLHDLRRSLGSWAAMSGASLAVIGRALGHKSVDATQIYARLQVDPVREAMEQATSRMFGRGGISSAADVVKLKQERAA